ncbi:type II secretion system protein [Neptunomonas antarctica]|uniref:Prepilin-type N-terminal cleavage/methylation domain-containing protein n=1 Tax=Neptunomonas antarctica TaxID=619304 RepID=A0A1N7MMU3_9GAMM|nr:type II secretion system protein [Neptunomonas antarctica]SIS87466.1 prepilin-type N-terminal cleavage/methylation domain-containing protein [Neptunomonas antarctica]
MARNRGSRGFTLLELIVSLLVIVVLYGVLSVRLGTIAESTERASVYGMLGQIQQQLNFRATEFYIDGTPDKFANLVKENPFSWFPAHPAQYAGEITAGDGKEILAGRWYFDVAHRELIYRVQRNKYLKIKGNDNRNLRFVLNLSSNSADNQQYSAVYSAKIQTVQPFVWEINAPSE